MTEKRRISDWDELIDAINTPVRYPKFPELTSAGEWTPWAAEPVIGQSSPLGVVQPTRATSSLGYLTANTRLCGLPFRFKPLPDGHIRLLDLHKAKIRNSILVGFKLITVPLCSAPRYGALSYCWGSTDLCTGIFISTRRNKKRVYRVTEHLATFLHNNLVVQRFAEDRLGYIWIDQICINQDDVAERNAQVRRMADIYKNAARVIVWLGQKSAFDEENFDITTDADLHMEWRGKPFMDWLRLWAVFGRPWFFRQWVFQEAVFAQHLYFMLDTGMEPLSALWHSNDLLDDFMEEEQEQTFAHEYTFGPDINHIFLYSVRTYVLTQNPDYEDLTDLLRNLDVLECQDQRDKVFSLLGFFGGILPADFVNYECPAASVFQKFARHLILNTESLRVITFKDSESMKRRPSWVPVWKKHVQYGFSSIVRNPAASLGRKWRSSLMVVEDELNVSGRVIDHIATEVPSFLLNVEQYHDKHFASVLRRPFHEACALISHIQKIELTGNIPSKEQWDLPSEPVTGPHPGILRSSFSHFFNTVFLIKEEIESDFSILIQGLNDEQALARLAGLTKIGCWYDPVLLVFESGRLGLVKNAGNGPPQVGDAIVILHGLDTPCILRKSEDGEGWLFVAEIYIHDIMHGEGKFGKYCCLWLH